MNVLLYGAGNCCDLYLNYYKSENESIVGIVDKDPSKSGKYKNNIRIFPLRDIDYIQFDKLIIVVEDYEKILDFVMDKEIVKEKVFIYCRKNNNIISFVSLYDEYINRKLYLNQSIVQIKIGLLMEALQESEFLGYKKIIVIGEHEDYIIIQKFFEQINIKTNVEYCLKIKDLLLNDKIILCGKDYKIDFENIKDKLFNNHQCIVIPLFDVKNTIVLKTIDID